MEDEVARIRSRIRRWREDERLTLMELAGRAGLAPSTIQKIETGQMTPSLAVLLKLVRGLGRSATELLESAQEVEIRHQRACERAPVGLASRLEIERLSGDLPKPLLETWRVTLHPGFSSGSDPIHFEGEEMVLCEAGRVTFRVGEAEYELLPGDSLHFKARVPHAFYNEGSEPARFTITGTHPPRFRAVMESRAADAAPRTELYLPAAG